MVSSLFTTMVQYNDPISCSDLPLTREQDPLILDLLHLGKQLTPYLKWAVHCFLAENHGLGFGGGDPHSHCCTLSCKQPKEALKVTA